MRYKEKIITHAEYIEGNVERLIQDVESNRVNRETLIKSLNDILVKSDYLLNLVNLED